MTRDSVPPPPRPTSVAGRIRAGLPVSLNDRYAVCPACGADGEIEGTLETAEPARLGDPAKLLELMHCPACKHRWWETWVYVGQEAIA